MGLDIFLAVAGILLFLSVFANKLSSHLGIPSLLIFLAIGMLAGSDGAGVQFYSAEITNAVGTISLAFILFAGGLESQWTSIKSVIFRGSVLSTVGVALTALFMFLLCRYMLDIDQSLSILISVIVSSTDAPAVFSILRSNNLFLKNKKLKSILEFESGSNDPMAVILSVGAISLLSGQGLSIHTASVDLLLQLVLGIFSGIVFGQLFVFVLKKFSSFFLGLYPVFGVAVVFLVFSLTQLVDGNGFLAIYICGIFLGNNSYPYHKPFLQFQDALSWVLQVAMFLTLGLLVNPHELEEVFWISLDATVCLVFFARPIAVFICLYRSEYSFSEKVFISWAGLKGAVPIILATYPLMAGMPNSAYLFNLIFFLVIISVLFQGRSLAGLARILKLTEPEQFSQSELAQSEKST